MAKREILAGATDQTIDVFIQDSSSTTGAGLTGLAFNSAGLTCYYRKGATGSATALTLATQTVGGAHSDGGFVQIDSTNMPGTYRLDLSDTIVATAGMVTIYLRGATNMVPCVAEIEVVSVNKFDSVRMGLTALPNAAAEAAGGLYTRGTGAGQINQAANGQVDVNIVNAAGTAWGSGAITAASIATGAITSAKFAAGAIDATVIATGAIDADSLATDAVDEIWEYATTNIATAGGIGKLIVDNLNTTVSSRSSHSAADVWASGTRTLTGLGFTLGASDLAADTITAAKIADGAIDRATFAADTGLQTVRSNTAQAGGATSITLDASASATNDFYAGQRVYLTGGTGAGQDRLVTAYNGTTKVATVDHAWATNPDATSTFAIVPNGRSDVETISLDATAADNAESAFDGTGYNVGGGSIVAASVTGAVGSVTGSVGSVTGNVGGNVVGSVGSISGVSFPSNFAALGINASGHISRVTLTDTLTTYTGNTPQTGDGYSLLTSAVADSVPADGTRPSPVQALYMICQGLFEGVISGTTWTIRKVDGSTALFTVTLDSATTPTSKTRAT